MRMWMVNPKYMCNKHLLGEHVEIHMLVGSLIKGTSIKGFLAKGLLEPQNITLRHEELVNEMKARGMNHCSPLPTYPLPTSSNYGKVDLTKSEIDLLQRCTDCFERKIA